MREKLVPLVSSLVLIFDLTFLQDSKQRTSSFQFVIGYSRILLVRPKSSKNEFVNNLRNVKVVM